MKVALFASFLLVTMGIAVALSRRIARQQSPSAADDKGGEGLRIPLFSALYFLLTVIELYPVLAAVAVIDALTAGKRTHRAELAFISTLFSSVILGLVASHWLGP